MRSFCLKTNLLLSCVLGFGFAAAQTAPDDSAVYAERIIWGAKKTVLTMDFSAVDHPASVADCHPVFHTPPVRQDTTNTCWCFSGLSFVESELHRLNGLSIKLSEMYIVYWEYVEKARRWVREKGNSEFGEGSEQEAVLIRMKEYGAVPESDYTGLLNGQIKHNHVKLIRELQDFLAYLKAHDQWDEEYALANVRLILDRHLGRPPETVLADGKRMTPREFLEKKLRFPVDDYASFQSCMTDTFYTRGEFKVPDNWWHSREYWNVPLDDWMAAVTQAIRNGYSAAIGGDVSESGKDKDCGLAVVPSFDIPDPLIDQSSRELRIYNQTTGDDHGIHIVGTARAGDHDWFLIKDSGSGAHEGPYKGYSFYRDDFVKLKMLTFLVHRDAVKDLLRKCEKN
jgi:bleomycin hydrolase